MTEPDTLKPLKCRVEVKSEILGNQVFWEGIEKDIPEIRNVGARIVARKVFETGEYHNLGMWHGYPIAAEAQINDKMQNGSI